jgi:hypothetical protein
MFLNAPALAKQKSVPTTAAHSMRPGINQPVAPIFLTVESKLHTNPPSAAKRWAGTFKPGQGRMLLADFLRSVEEANAHPDCCIG